VSSPGDNADYCWTVICQDTTVLFGHKIPLAQTGAFESLPISGSFSVRCEECGQENSHEPEEVLRVECTLPEPFTPHPRFR